MFRIVTML